MNQSTHSSDSRMGRKIKGNGKYIWRNFGGKPPKSKGNSIPVGFQTRWTQTGLHQDIC